MNMLKACGNHSRNLLPLLIHSLKYPQPLDKCTFICVGFLLTSVSLKDNIQQFSFCVNYSLYSREVQKLYCQQLVQTTYGNSVLVSNKESIQCMSFALLCKSSCISNEFSYICTGKIPSVGISVVLNNESIFPATMHHTLYFSTPFKNSMKSHLNGTKNVYSCKDLRKLQFTRLCVITDPSCQKLLNVEQLDCKINNYIFSKLHICPLEVLRMFVTLLAIVTNTDHCRMSELIQLTKI